MIEFQNSRISVDEVETRERFYKKMIWVISKNQLEISKHSLETLIEEVNEITNKFLADRINTYLRIPEHILNELDKFVSEALGKEYIGKQEINQFIKLFNENIEQLCGKNFNSLDNDVSFEPNKTKEDLIKPLSNKIIEGIKSRNHPNDVFYRYKIVKGSKTWNYVSCPLFLDTGDELNLLYPNEIAKNVSKEKFVKYYSQIKI